MTPPALTFVTTCMGRLRFLRETLPLLAAQPATACVVVDYGCPDHCGDWVQAHLPQVKVVRWPAASTFHAAHARNLGAAAAVTEVLCLIDGDIRVDPDFAPAILAQFDPRCYYLAEPLAGDISGTVVCARAAFAFAEGYDEACTGWGGEDLDLYDRLEFHGIRRAGFPARLLAALPHPDAERTAHSADADKEVSNSINLLYSHIKLDLMRLSGSRLPAGFRAGLHAQVRDAYAASVKAGGPARIDVPYAEGTINYCDVQTSLGYVIDVSVQAGRRVAGTPISRRMTTAAGAQP
ncbi:MAG: glycosyltransferase family 2 protein [Betaproteobacteria bacterium]|nr:glycosyltransferase family 2 protein [Betaproteobacteria bacterium]